MPFHMMRFSGIMVKKKGIERSVESDVWGVVSDE